MAAARSSRDCLRQNVGSSSGAAVGLLSARTLSRRLDRIVHYRMNIMRDTNMHQHVLQAAREAFSEKGYGVSMDEIADRAGVSKQTLYNHFPGKQQLFLEVVRESAAVLASTLTNSELNLREALVRWGESYRQQAFAQQGLAMHRLLVAEAPRIPELAREVFMVGPAVAHAHLVQVLSAAEMRGELSMPDVAFAADMLISMLA
ncbi:MAG TPA: TetR/AcrR family transcriptional regulator, partial [Rhodocyclaceae bacterium]|nr:TetR/AcrR family transcriptional regulator [Rhodocyclaceae bacterium]